MKTKFALRRALLLTMVLFCACGAEAAIGMHELADSIDTYYNPFMRDFAPKVRVTSVRQQGGKITLRTNLTLGGVAWTTESLRALKQDVSRWMTDRDNLSVTIYSGTYTLDELLTDRIRPREKHFSEPGNGQSLSGKTIAIWPSHGLYLHPDRQEWIFQRATLFTTVEDLLSQQYTMLVIRELENAGATVITPRARPDQPEGWLIGESGMPRWMEAARYWLQYQGITDSIWNAYPTNPYTSDIRCRGLWVNRQKDVDACLAIHTDGYILPSDSLKVGTLAIYTHHNNEGKKTLCNGVTRQVSRDLGDYVQTQVVEDIRAVHCPDWPRRQLNDADYGESRMPNVPSIILEILSHQNPADIRLGLDPRFQRTVARAIYKGVLQFIKGDKGQVTPLAPSACSCRAEGKDWLLSWQPTPDSLCADAMPESYVLFVRRSASAEDSAEPEVQRIETKQPRYRLPIREGERVDWWVEAVNDGGHSSASEQLSMYRAPKDSLGTILIVNGFTQTYGPDWFATPERVGVVHDSYGVADGHTLCYIGQQWNDDRQSRWRDDDNCGLGMCYRDYQGQAIVGNTYDYAVRHGRVLQQMGRSYCSTSLAAFCAAEQDTTCVLIDYIAGKQRAEGAVPTIPYAAQQRLSAQQQRGARLLLSGSYIASGMQDALSRIFTRQTMGYQLQAPRATHSGKLTGSLLTESATATQAPACRILTTPSSELLFAEAPDALRPEAAAQRLLHYQDGRMTAAVGLPDRSLTLGFPLEATDSFPTLLRQAISWLTSSK